MTPPPAAATLPGRVVRPGRSRQRVRALPPRRISGPAKRVVPGRSGRHSLRSRPRIDQQLPDRLLDRLIGGRAWIAVIAFALIGIVGMQLWVMKLGVGIGRAVDHTQLLQQENSALSAEDSALSSAERIERLALARGMVPASPAALHFDTVRGPLDARLAAAALAKPIQAPTAGSSTSPVGGATTSPEASAGAAGGEASAGATSGEPSSTSGTAGAATVPSSTTSTGAEATPAQAPTASETTAAQAQAPAATAAAPTAATGGSPEASGAGGGAQAAPGG
jgi:cell division protein FtsL